MGVTHECVPVVCPLIHRAALTQPGPPVAACLPALYLQASMDEVERALFEAHHCPSWFTADNRLGQLSITLEPPDCFNAEEYATVREGRGGLLS